MYIYNYDAITKEYLGFQEAEADPRETQIQGHFVPSIPANATIVQPPAPEINKAIVWDVDKWEYIADYRDNFYKVDSNLDVLDITELGDIEEGYILVTKEMGDDIKANPKNYVIDGDTVRAKKDVEKLTEAKEQKYNEALGGARAFIDNEAIYQFDENNSIEATDGNIGKMTAYALAFQTGTLEEVQWTSKEDNVIILHAEDVLNILIGLGDIQSDVWNVQFIEYKTAIEEAQTVAEVEAIEVHYVN